MVQDVFDSPFLRLLFFFLIPRDTNSMQKFLANYSTAEQSFLLSFYIIFFSLHLQWFVVSSNLATLIYLISRRHRITKFLYSDVSPKINSILQ